MALAESASNRNLTALKTQAAKCRQYERALAREVRSDCDWSEDRSSDARKRVEPTAEFELHLDYPTKPELPLAMSTTEPPTVESRTRPWSPWESLAARQGQTITYDTPDRLDVCPHLRSRIDGACSAV